MKTCVCMCVWMDGWMKPFVTSSVMTAFKRFFWCSEMSDQRLSEDEPARAHLLLRDCDAHSVHL